MQPRDGAVAIFLPSMAAIDDQSGDHHEPIRFEGIGRLLMQHAERWAGEQGCNVVRLWSSAGRSAAHEFYETIGYKNIKTQYSFAKALGQGSPEDLKKLVPRIDVEGS